MSYPARGYTPNQNFVRRSNGMTLSLEKYLGDRWVRTALASDLEAAERHARAVGGRVQALSRDGDFICEWLDGIRVSLLTADEIKAAMRAAAPGAQRLLQDMKDDQLRGAEAAARIRLR